MKAILLALTLLAVPALGQEITYTDAIDAIDDASGELSNAQAEWDGLDQAVDDLVDAHAWIHICMPPDPDGWLAEELRRAETFIDHAENLLAHTERTLELASSLIDDPDDPDAADAWWNLEYGLYFTAHELATSARDASKSSYQSLAIAHAVIADHTELLWTYTDW